MDQRLFATRRGEYDMYRLSDSLHPDTGIHAHTIEARTVADPVRWQVATPDSGTHLLFQLGHQIDYIAGVAETLLQPRDRIESVSW